MPCTLAEEVSSWLINSGMAAVETRISQTGSSFSISHFFLEGGATEKLLSAEASPAGLIFRLGTITV